MQDNKPKKPIVLLMIAIAIILATGVFLTISVIQGRNGDTELEVPANNFLVTVGSEQVSLQVDPNQRFNIVESPETDNNPRVEATSDPQVVEATITPAATAVPNTPVAATAVPNVDKIIFIDYTVQQGDTLYSITQRIDTSIALMADKGLSQASLVPGQTIKLPIGNTAYCSGKGRPYAVGEGDTAFNIGQRFNTTPENLRMINNLDEKFTVKVADIICVP
ncbi:MAG: LysM peptidoglycan-binding domain-containing protein [Chloroflexi bacterium]|nr:LysM peptidoglycan-binding domain-containing protein [Chloroflexota bacterium]